MKNLFRTIKLLTICSVLSVQVFVYAGVVNAQPAIVKDPLTTDQSAERELPKYNAGVDQSIADYLCVPTGKGTDLYDCIGKLYRFGIAAGAISLVFFIVIAGYFYITGGEQGKGKGKGVLMNAATGMGILLFSYVLTGKVGANCQPAPSGPGSIEALSKSCFAKYGEEVVRQASIVANAESAGGTPGLPVGAGSCGKGKPPARCAGGEIPVFGMFQINLAAHEVYDGNKLLNCKSAFANGFTCNNGCRVTNTTLYNQCVTAVKKVENDINTACLIYEKSKKAGNHGFQPWGNSGNLHYQRCGFK